MEMSDLAAVAAVRAGDRDAFRVLVEKHSQMIFRLAYRMTDNEHDAEEVVQESFLRAYKKIYDFESRANFGTWLYRIASNCCLDLLARRKGQQSYMSVKDDEGEELPLATPQPGPERILLSTELRAKLAEAMKSLTPQERVAFVMRHFEGHSIEEIAKALSVKDGSAKNTVFRAVQKIRSAMGPLMCSAR
jgi:RNA polymerase sigma-70 factor, ECF subfamily